MNLKEAVNTKKSFTIDVDGNIEFIDPENGKYFSLNELQSIVEGYIEMVYLKDPKGWLMILNEEGKIHELPINNIATELWNKTNNNDYIAGNVLVCKMSQMK